ncbi:hypothetical protein Tco_0155514 [Tanacetum coccineum]
MPSFRPMIDQCVYYCMAARVKQTGMARCSHTSGTVCPEGLIRIARRMHLTRLLTIVGHDVAYAMTWTELKKKMTDKYCLRNEMKKLETELWNLKVKEFDRVETRYVGGLRHDSWKCLWAFKTKNMQEATEWKRVVEQKD